MSRVGNQPIEIPSGVSVDIKGDAIQVKGPKGQLSQDRIPHVDVTLEDGKLIFKRTSEGKEAWAYHGLYRALVRNMVEGVSQGFSKKLEVIGIGFRADVKGRKLVLHLGFSHPIEFEIPDGIDIQVDKNLVITVSGIDKQQVGHVAAVIRDFRKPDHYKGKGIRYQGEYVRLKAGKSA